MRFPQIREYLFPKRKHTNLHTQPRKVPQNRQTERKTKSNNPPNPQMNPKHLLQMSPVRSPKIPPPRTRKSLNDRRQRRIPCYMVLGDLGPEMHEGILFFCTATHFTPPSDFWLGSFLVLLYGKFDWL